MVLLILRIYGLVDNTHIPVSCFVCVGLDIGLGNWKLDLMHHVIWIY